MIVPYKLLRVAVSVLSVLSVPLGVAIGWMMATGHTWFLVGIIFLMYYDWFSSRAWIKTIETAIEERLNEKSNSTP